MKITAKDITKTNDPQEEEELLGFVIKKIKENGIRIEAISLGKLQDGTHNITLADIWSDDLLRQI